MVHGGGRLVARRSGAGKVADNDNGADAYVDNRHVGNYEEACGEGGIGDGEC